VKIKKIVVQKVLYGSNFELSERTQHWLKGHGTGWDWDGLAFSIVIGSDRESVARILRKDRRARTSLRKGGGFEARVRFVLRSGSVKSFG